MTSQNAVEEDTTLLQNLNSLSSYNFIKTCSVSKRDKTSFHVEQTLSKSNNDTHNAKKNLGNMRLFYFQLLFQRKKQ